MCSVRTVLNIMIVCLLCVVEFSSCSKEPAGESSEQAASTPQPAAPPPAAAATQPQPAPASPAAEPSAPPAPMIDKPANLTGQGSGARMVSFSSQYNTANWKAANLIDGKPDVGWCSSSASSFPYTFVVELPRTSEISRVSFDNGTEERRRPGISAKEVKVYVSLEAEDIGYKEVATFTLTQGESAQGFRLPSPARARWIKLNVVSNHGNSEYTELMEFRAIGTHVQ